jgi:hypothetical protein
LGTKHFTAGKVATPPKRKSPLSKMRQAEVGKFPMLLQMPDESPQVAKTNQKIQKSH